MTSLYLSFTYNNNVRLLRYANANPKFVDIILMFYQHVNNAAIWVSGRGPLGWAGKQRQLSVDDGPVCLCGGKHQYKLPSSGDDEQISAAVTSEFYNSLTVKRRESQTITRARWSQKGRWWPMRSSRLLY